MIKDKYFKAVCIPVLGVIIPLLARVVNYAQLTAIEIIITNIFFIAVSYVIWHGAVAIVINGRRLKRVRQQLFFKLFLLCFCTALYGFTGAWASALLWQSIVLHKVYMRPAFNGGIICAGIVVFLTLVYEILFLSKERELDVKIVDQLDNERLNAEIAALKGELDPHFLFNSLTALSHLISNDAEKAQIFTHKLSLVYKYLLMNKDRDLISLEDELKFIDDYFYLLNIRYDDKVKLETSISGYNSTIMIVPCSLQVLIENAVKHNRFSDEAPLTITVNLNNEYLKVENEISNKQTLVSTRIGLSNLSARYRLICGKDITVSRSENKFMVKLPLIKQNVL